MREERETAARLAAYSDAVFAVIVTVMVLELLFAVSLLPFATAWVARTRLASTPVVVYAGLFVCIDLAYNVFERDVLVHADPELVSARTQHVARARSLVVLAVFAVAMLVAFIAPRIGFCMIVGALLLHLRPDVSGSRAGPAPSQGNRDIAARP